jgi:predicted transcriptional regulator/DNA-binding XRE family transcriptional regulator
MPDRRYGSKVRALRRRAGITQAALAEQLGVSASYLNLIENDRRPLTTDLLFRLAKCFELDLRSFGGDDDAHLASDLTEIFGDAVFDDHPLTARDLAEFASRDPAIARAVIRLHHAYTEARASADILAQRVLEHQDVVETGDRVRLSSEQASDLLYRHGNYFPELEAAAESLWRDAALDGSDLFTGLARYMGEVHHTSVKVVPVSQMQGAVRRFDVARRELLLSEALHRSSRSFQLATQIALMNCRDAIERILAESDGLSADAEALGRVVLASYFAGAVLMPYTNFLRAAEEARYDIELLGQRFGTGFEQVCHRLITLRRPGMEGIQFYFVRIDMAGNISKKFSAAGIRFPRFSGVCGLWNVHAAFLQPGVVRVQICKQLNGRTVFAIARTVRRRAGAYHTPAILHSVGIGCDISDAHRLVYADGMDLTNPASAVPIGITCRLCERFSCAARAAPSIHHPLTIDENVRGVSFFASLDPSLAERAD